jgi:RES domain-containing protein
MPFVTAHKDFPRFFNVLKNNPAMFTPRAEDVFRQGVPRWISRPYRFTGVGSVFAGARWSVKGLMPTLYGSTTLATLAAEAYYKSRRFGWTPAQFQPQLTIQMRWELQAVVDLTNAATLKALKVTTKEIVACDWETEQAAGQEPVTQAIARAAFENLAEGLVVPSARHKGGVNIVYYPSHRRDGTVIQTLNEAMIPFMHGL